MRHVIGIAIKDFSFDPKIARQLKIDYMMMVNITRDFERNGEEVVFYVVTMNQFITLELHKVIRNMSNKGHVDIVFLTADQFDFQQNFYLLPQKPTDIGGVYVLALDSLDNFPEEDRNLFAESVSHSCLHRNISRRETNIQEITERYRMPAGLDITYYGIV